MTFREKLIALRARDHLTQSALARAVGVTRQAVYMWEKGQSYPEAETLLALRRLFGISIDDLLDDAVSLPDAGSALAKPRKQAPRAAETEGVAAIAEREEADEPAPYEAPSAVEIAKTPLQKVEKPAPKAPEPTTPRHEPLRAKVEPSHARKSGSILDLVGAFLRKRK
ncbi:MAG: helix-turn-helix domain-containing protein [Clostridia bacterium]|nr:helix-turn-helix domain-containing protein [Clostridia bacterium]